MRVTKFKYLNGYPEQYRAFMELVAKWEMDTGDDRSEFNLDKYEFRHHLGAGISDDVMVAEHLVTGPREPALVWTGSGGRWICSEDDLSGPEVELMDAIAAQCPGGLGGWS